MIIVVFISKFEKIYITRYLVLTIYFATYMKQLKGVINVSERALA